MKCSISTSIGPDENLHFTLPEPATRVDTALFHLFVKQDSTYHEAPFRLTRDSLTMLRYTLRAEWRPKQEYVLNVDSAAISGLSGLVNKPLDLKFTIADETSYGSLFLLLPDADSTAIVQLMQADDKVEKQLPIRDGRVDFFYLKPGKYYVRLFNDRNHNGRWDTGSYATGLQPEEVYYYPQVFEVRANWDIEQTWRLTDLPLTQQKPRALIKQKEDAKKTPKSRNAERERKKREG